MITDQPSFHVLVDESGDQGFQFSCSDCSKWFVVSAVVSLSSTSQQLSSLAREIKGAVEWNAKVPLHFKKVRNEERRRSVIRAIASQTSLYRAVSVMIAKECLVDQEAFTEHNRLYFYAVRMLLERVSWLCAASREYRLREHGNGTARVIFSNMNEISREKLCSYFSRLKKQTTAIDWRVICPTRFDTLSPGRHAGLQFADAIASGFFCAEHHVEKPRTEEWAAALKPIMYRSERGKYLGYGLKLYPENEIAQRGYALWAKRWYS